MNPKPQIVLGLVGGLAWSTMSSGAEQRLIAESTFQDWSAHVVQTTLADGSVLSEYLAQSYAAAQATNRLDISFIPRFGCTPITSVVVTAEEDSMTDSPQELNFVIDGQQLRFPVLADRDANSERFTLNASSEVQSRLRLTLDLGSRASVSIVGYGHGNGELAGLAKGMESAIPSVVPSSMPSVTQIKFSLLGSKKAAKVAQTHCLSHEPIPFESN